jgi:hypothetical protein
VKLYIKEFLRSSDLKGIKWPESGSCSGFKQKHASFWRLLHKKKYIYFLLILLLIFEKKQPQSLKQGLAKGPRAFSRLLLALSVLQMAGKYRG